MANKASAEKAVREIRRKTRRRFSAGTFRSVRDLVEKIDRFVREYNRRCCPFVWTATPDAIFEKVERICKAVAGTGH